MARGVQDAAAPQARAGCRKPQDVDLLDRPQRGVVIVERQPLEQWWVILAPLGEHRIPVGAWHPDLHVHPGADLREQRLHLNTLTDFRPVWGTRVRLAVGIDRHCDGHILVEAPDAVCGEPPVLIRIDWICVPSVSLLAKQRFEESPVLLAQLDEAAPNLPGPRGRPLALPPREGQRVPDTVLPDRHGSVYRQPHGRPDVEAHYEGVVFRVEDRRVILVRAVDDIEDTHPARQPRHVAQ